MLRPSRSALWQALHLRNTRSPAAGSATARRSAILSSAVVAGLAEATQAAIAAPNAPRRRACIRPNQAATRSEIRCIALFRYPLGFQATAKGCMRPRLSVARAQIS